MVNQGQRERDDNHCDGNRQHHRQGRSRRGEPATETGPPGDARFAAASVIPRLIQDVGCWQALLGRVEEVVFELGEDCHR